jgi:hypothetical protein
MGIIVSTLPPPKPCRCEGLPDVRRFVEITVYKCDSCGQYWQLDTSLNPFCTGGYFNEWEKCTARKAGRLIAKHQRLVERAEWGGTMSVFSTYEVAVFSRAENRTMEFTTTAQYAHKAIEQVKSWHQNWDLDLDWSTATAHSRGA